MNKFLTAFASLLCLSAALSPSLQASMGAATSSIYKSEGVMDKRQCSEVVNETKAEAGSLMTTWADAFLGYQIKGTGSVHLDGSFICPACKAIHGRTIDDVWPLVWLWDRTGEQKYLDAAIDAVNWGKANQQKEEGSYTNDPGSGWVGITIFTQTAIGKTLTHFGDKLPDSFRKTLEELYAAQTEYIKIWINIPDLGVNVNYRAAYPLAMEIAARYYHNDAYHREAAKQAARVVGYIGKDGILYGEADPLDAVTPRGFHGVDMGYNIEESLPVLLEYAELAEDKKMMAKLTASAAAHLDFFLPDGAIDDSFGSRAYKWSYWGSRTSDGCLAMLSVLARNGYPEALGIAEKVLKLYRQCTGGDGLLSGGYSFIESGEPACIHHTFCHLKSLPDWIDADFSCLAGKPAARIFGWKSFGIKYYPTCGVHLIGTDQWRATVNESDSYFHDDNGKSTGGGSLTLLYHKELGPVTSASMPKYTLVERMNMQTLSKGRSVRCLTPRIQQNNYLSVYDDKAEISVKSKGRKVLAKAEGVLTDISDKREGGKFKLSYTFDDNKVYVDAVTGNACDFILPVIVLPQDEIVIDGKTATIKREKGTIVIKSSSKIFREKTDRPDDLMFNPIGGFLAVYLRIPFEGNLNLSLSVQ